MYDNQPTKKKHGRDETDFKTDMTWSQLNNIGNDLKDRHANISDIQEEIVMTWIMKNIILLLVEILWIKNGLQYTKYLQ